MKRSLKTILLLAVLIALFAGYKLVGSLNEKSQVAEEAGTFTLTDKTADDLTALEWTNENVSYRFTRSDEVWSNANNADFPVNQDAVQALADDLLALEADRKLENVENRADYGLETPAFAVTAEWSDGSQTEYAMGDETPFADGWYLARTDDEAVYTVGYALDSMFSDTLTDLAELEQLPSVETAKRLVIGDKLDAAWQEVSTTLNSDQHWYESETGSALSDSFIETLVETVRNLEWNALIYVTPTGEEINACGLNSDNATLVTLHGENDDKISVYLGATDENGDYYARLEDSNMIYTVSAEAGDDLLYFNEDSVYNAELIPLAIENLKTAEFVTGDGNWQITYEKTVGDDDDAEALPAATVNGEEADAAEIENLWTWVQSITRTSFVSDEIQNNSILLTINVLNRSDISATFNFCDYDTDSYLACGSDGTTVLVSADTVDRIIRTLKQF